MPCSEKTEMKLNWTERLRSWGESYCIYNSFVFWVLVSCRPCCTFCFILILKVEAKCYKTYCQHLRRWQDPANLQTMHGLIHSMWPYIVWTLYRPWSPLYAQTFNAGPRCAQCPDNVRSHSMYHTYHCLDIVHDLCPAFRFGAKQWWYSTDKAPRKFKNVSIPSQTLFLSCQVNSKFFENLLGFLCLRGSFRT